MGGKAHGGARVSRGIAEEIQNRIYGQLADAVVQLDVAGSMRRGKEDVGDLDLVIVPKMPKHPEIVIEAMKIWFKHDEITGRSYLKACSTGKWQPTLIDLFLVQQFGLQKNGKPGRSGLVDGVQVDIYLTTVHAHGAMLAYATGSMEFNIQCRAAAMRRGWSLNQYGIVIDGKTVEYSTEESLFAALGVKWKEPWER